MTTAKSLFLAKDPEGKPTLAHWWTGICRDPRFEMVLIFARADMMEGKPTQASLEGAEKLITTLLTLTDNEDGIPEMPTPGLHHDFNVPKLTTDNAT